MERVEPRRLCGGVRVATGASPAKGT